MASGVCEKQLVVTGALVANKVNLMRTHEGGGLLGGTTVAGSGPAEIINFSPEFFLSKPILRSDFIDEDALNTVLIKDLPPVY